MFNFRIVAVGAACLIGAPMALGQVDPQARGALEKMIETVDSATTISYRVQMHGEGGMFGLLPRSSAKVTIKRQDPPVAGPSGNWRIRIDGRSEGIEEPFEFIVVSDGQRYSWIDHENRRLIYRPHSSSRGRPTDTAVQLQIPGITEASPLQRELAAPTIEVVEQVTVDGQNCDVVLVDPGEMLPKMRWTIARADGMPRRAERLLQGGTFNDRQVWTITDVKVNIDVDDGMFKLSAPEGYTTVGAPVVARPEVTTTTESTQDSDDSSVTKTRNAPRTVGTGIGNMAPDFELSMPNGEKVRLSELRGQVVLLDFWGTWCLPCRRSSPQVQKVHDDYKDRGVKVLGLAVRERNDENPVNYMKEHNYTYGLLLRADEAANQFRVRVYPTFIVIGREGEIAHIEDAFDPETTFQQIRRAIDRSLGEPQKTRAGEGDEPAALAPAGVESGDGEKR